MPTPSVSVTTTEESVTGIAIGVTLVGLVVITAVTLILIVVISLKKQHCRTKATNVADTIQEYEEIPDIALSSNIHVEINPRGRIRRRTMDTQEFETPRARAVRSYYSNYVYCIYTSKGFIKDRYKLACTFKLQIVANSYLAIHSFPESMITPKKALRASLIQQVDLPLLHLFTLTKKRIKLPVQTHTLSSEGKWTKVSSHPFTSLTTLTTPPLSLCLPTERRTSRHSWLDWELTRFLKTSCSELALN